jgi:NAD(P)-dependent dehydrogenase (short-subunit alcohol dehydrogenase family)
VPGDPVHRPRGSAVTSSIAATAPGPYHATYAASKAFLLSFAEALRYELRDTGVTVTALMPGPTDTEFFDRAGMQDTRLADMNKDDPADVARKAACAALAPHAPCTPPPGCADDDARYSPVTRPASACMPVAGLFTGRQHPRAPPPVRAVLWSCDLT